MSLNCISAQIYGELSAVGLLYAYILVESLSFIFQVPSSFFEKSSLFLLNIFIIILHIIFSSVLFLLVF